MTAVGHVVKIMAVKFGTLTTVECAVTSATLTPSVQTQTTTTACADGTITDSAPATWTWDVAYNIDAAATSFSSFLAEHEGEVVKVEWTPDPTGNPARIREFDVVVTPGPEAYQVGSFAAASVSLPVRGKPAWKAAAP